MEIIGSRLRLEDTVPVDVIGAAELAAIPSAELATATGHLPWNTGGEQRADIFSGLQAGTAAINMRGLGLGNTLVLIDGRRSLLSGAVSGDGASYVDVNQFPRIMIERIEILKDGATAIYGSDAVAGVVSYVPRRGFQGLELGGSFRWTPESNPAWRSNYEAIWGWTGDRTSLQIGGAFYQKDRQRTTRRSFTDPDFRSNSRGGISALGSPGSFRPDTLRDPATGSPIPGSDGGPAFHDIPEGVVATDALGREIDYAALQSTLRRFGLENNLGMLDPTCQRSGVDGREGTRFFEFIPGAGFCGFSFIDNFDLQYKTKRYNAFVMLERELSENLELFSDFLYYRNEVDKAGVSPSFPLLNFPTVPDHNPANFFGVPMRFSGRTLGEAFPGQEGDSDDTKTRTLVGLRGRIPDGTNGLPGDNWTWELSGAYERATRTQGNADVVWPRFVLAVNGLGGAECPVNVGQGLEGGLRAIVDPRAAETLDLGAINANLDNLVSSDRVLAAGPGQNGCEYFNPFGSALIEPEQGNSSSLTRWLLGPGGAHNLRTSTTTTLKLVDGVIRGDLWTLPAGPAELALSYQFRQDEYDVRRDLGQQVTRMYVFIAGGNSFTSEQDMHAIGAELRLPVHEQLEVHAAVRWSDYGGAVGSSVDPKLALRWQINDWLSLRASAGTTFRAPTLSQKRSERTVTVFVTDLLNPVLEAFSDLPTSDFRAGDIVGSMDLKPEETVTYNAGLIARPFDAWQVTLDYWRIVFDDRMAPQVFQQVVDAENSITGAIFLQEGCSTRLIAAAEGLGVLRNPLTCEIERVRARYVNTAGVVTDGIDVISSYGIDLRGLGDLRLSFSGSHIIQYVISGDNSRDVSGQLNRSSFARPLPKYKFNVQAAWARDQHRAFLTWRHISPYENDLSDRLLNGTKISAWNTFDFVYSRGVGDRTTFTLGVSNMFDQDPPAVHGLDLQYDPWTHDPFGRMLYTELKVRLD